MHRMRGLLAAATAGILLALCFPPFDAPWPVMIAALALWFTATEGRRRMTSVLHSFVFMFCFYAALLRWMVAIGIDAWVGLALLEALFFLPVAIARAVAPAAPWALPATVALWPLMDWVRDHAGPVAFGWGQLAFANVEAPWAGLPVSQWVVTGYIVALGCAVAVLRTGPTPVRLIALGVVVLGLTVPSLVRPTTQDVHTTVPVALVQGGVDRTGMGNLGDRRAVMRRHARLSLAALEPGRARLVIWPENAVDVDPFTDAEAKATLLLVAHELRAPVLFGALLEAPEGRGNAAVLADQGTLQRVYVKRRLVPFGEVLPARELMTKWFARTMHIPIDFVPGETAGRLQIGGLRLGLVICFEIADGGLVSDAVAGGASALVVQTNNATYAGLGQSEQQLRIAQFRARNLHMPTIVISTTGPSAVIDTNGRIVQSIGEGRTGVLVTRLPAHRLPA